MTREHEAAVGPSSTPTLGSKPSDRDICDAYLYLLGRLLVLRQEHFDFISGARWNELEHLPVGNLQHATFDVACSEAWVAVDEGSYTLLELPRIVGRYYTVQVATSWGETLVNLNERTLPDHPWGSFAFCLKGSHLALPRGAMRIDLLGRKARVFVRVELGTEPQEAIRWQQQLSMRTVGKPVVPPAPTIALFPNEKMPGVEAFDAALAALATEQEIGTAMEPLQAKVRTVAALIRSDRERERVDEVLRHRTWGLKQALFQTNGDWVTQRLAGVYGSDWLARTAANKFALWSNAKSEVTSFKAGTVSRLDGDSTYVMTFERGNHPAQHVRGFWSVTCIDAQTCRVTPNRQERYSLGSHSRLRVGDHGALALYFSAKPPNDAPESNWLPTPAGRGYILIWRSYVPDHATQSGAWFPPELQRIP